MAIVEFRMRLSANRSAWVRRESENGGAATARERRNGARSVAGCAAERRMAGRAARFVWRERCDAINWRMLRAMDLADVVRRGDPARLEPLALHLTFARLPRTATTAAATATGDRDVWAVVRVLQLAMEYLLFMRSRDGDVVDSLHQQLQLCERCVHGRMGSHKGWMLLTVVRVDTLWTVA